VHIGQAGPTFAHYARCSCARYVGPPAPRGWDRSSQ
jgi:hypothetical protein